MNSKNTGKVVQIDTRRSHVVGAAGAMRKVTERDIDKMIADNRRRYDDAFDLIAEELEQRRAPARPSLIPLDNGMLARAIRALRWAFRLQGPRT